VLVLEDCHWLDPLSRDLLEWSPVAATRRVCCWSSSTGRGGAADRPRARTLSELEELPLGALEDGELGEVVRAKLAQRSGSNRAVPPRRSSSSSSRAPRGTRSTPKSCSTSSPRVDRHRRRRGARLTRAPREPAQPDLGRIDTLTRRRADAQGRERDRPCLPCADASRRLPRARDDRRGARQLETLRLLELVLVDRAEDESHLFKHAVTQEVVYESLPYALRAALTARGGYLEEQAADSAERTSTCSPTTTGMATTTTRSGFICCAPLEAAKASYANLLAIDYYERLAPLLPGRSALRRCSSSQRCSSSSGVGARARDRDARHELASAEGDERARARCETALAEVARKQGRFPEAAERLARAALAFGSSGDEQDSQGRAPGRHARRPTRQLRRSARATRRASRSDGASTTVR